MKKLQSINTYSGEVLAEYETLSDAEITQKIELAHKAFQSWRETSFAERKELFHRLADITEERIDELARLQTLEMGMLI